MKLIPLFLSFTLYLPANSQQYKASDSSIVKGGYRNDIKKYKGFKTAAWAVAGTGLAMLVVGVAQPAPHYYINNDPTLGFPKRKGYGLRVTGGMFGLGSIILFTLASKYKKRAAVALKAESVSIYGPANYQLPYTALSLKVKL